MREQGSTEEILPLLGQLYDATTDVNKWPVFLESISRMFNGFGANLNYYDAHDRLLSFTSFTGLPEGEKYTPLFIKNIPHDPRHPKNVNPEYRSEPDPEWMKGKPWADRMAVSESDLHQSRMYQEVLKPQNIEHTIISATFLESSDIIGFGIFRGPDDEPWNENDCNLLHLFVPHVRRAVTIHRRLARLDFERQSGLKSLDQINMGLMLLNESRQILFANQKARAILEKKDGISDDNTRLTISHPGLNQRLNEAVREVIEHCHKTNNTKGKGLSLPRPSGMRDYSLLISPVWGNLMRVQNHAISKPIVALFISDPETSSRIQYDLLKQLYRLTRTEAMIVNDLVQGITTRDLAARMRVQDNTIRQHLKNIYQKTGTDNQAGLVQKVLSSPIWLGSHMFSQH